MRSVMVQLSEDQITRLDVEAARKGVSRSSVVRSAVDISLRSRFDQAVADKYAQSYADGTFGSDAWGLIDEWHTAAAKSRVEHSARQPSGQAGQGDTW